MSRKPKSWIKHQTRHLSVENLSLWRAHPAVGGEMMRGFLFEWMADISPDTPRLPVHAAYALTRLYHLECCSAENAVLINACERTAKRDGWEKVSILVDIPSDNRHWSAYRFAEERAIAKYFEDEIDAQSPPFEDTHAWWALWEAANQRQIEAHESCDLADVLARVRAHAQEAKAK